MKALAANHERLEEEAKQKRKAGNMSAAVAESKQQVSIYTQREEEVATYLNELKLEKVKTGDDGNCFFYAMQGYGHIKGIPHLSLPVPELRQAVADTIIGDRYYLDFFPKMKNSDPEPMIALRSHETIIRKDRTWADEVDVAAFSKHFNVCIVVHDWYQTTDFPYHMKRLTYPNNCDEYQYRHIIHILRTNNNHYSLLMPNDDEEYNSLKLLLISLPLNPDVVAAQQNQVRQIATQVAPSNAVASSSPNMLQQYARNADSNLSEFVLDPKQVAQRLASKPLLGNSAATAIVLNNSSAVLRQHANHAQNALSQIKLSKSKNSPEELQRNIITLQKWIATLKEQIAQLEERSDHKENLGRKKAELLDKQAKLSKRQTKLAALKGGTRKKRKNKNKSRRRL